MCHHYRGARMPPSHLADEFSLRSNLYQLALPDIGFYPLDQVPLIRVDKHGDREMVAAEWGFLPGWWKPSDRTSKRQSFQRKTINARSEDVDAKPTYRESFRRRRCLMSAEEFFERGFYFHLADRRPFAFAALWDAWRDVDGGVLETCALLTTEPNDAVAAVGHSRMPVIFTKEEEYALWLNDEVRERGPLEGLLQPTPADLWHSYLAPPAAKTMLARAASDQRDRESRQGLLFD
jgi:putative SOS response-associated peptidase YedK